MRTNQRYQAVSSMTRGPEIFINGTRRSPDPPLNIIIIIVIFYSLCTAPVIGNIERRRICNSSSSSVGNGLQTSAKTFRN